MKTRIEWRHCFLFFHLERTLHETHETRPVCPAIVKRLLSAGFVPAAAAASRAAGATNTSNLPIGHTYYTHPRTPQRKLQKYPIVIGLNLMLSIYMWIWGKCSKILLKNPANSTTVSLHNYVSVLKHWLQIIANVITMVSSRNCHWLIT